MSINRWRIALSTEALLEPSIFEKCLIFMNKYYSCLLAVLISAITLLQAKSAVTATTQEKKPCQECRVLKVRGYSIEELNFSKTTHENKLWQETIAQIELNNYSIEELNKELNRFKNPKGFKGFSKKILEKMVIGILVSLSGEHPKDLLESDQENILSFYLEYDALIKKTESVIKKRIIQYGLYKKLHPKLQQSLKNNTSPTAIKIRYGIDYPTSIEFIINQEMIAVSHILDLKH